MAKHTIELNSIQPNTVAHVRGTLQYSVLTRLIDGVELQKKMARQQARGMRPTDKPHRTVTLSGVRIEPVQNNALEQYLTESFYTSKQHPEQGISLSHDGKGRFMPRFYQRTGNKLVEFVPDNELANGLDVTVEFNVYHTQNGNGIGIQRVIVNEPVRYYQSADENALFAQMGLEVQSMSRADREAAQARLEQNTAPIPTEPDVPAQVPNPVGNGYQTDGFQMPPAPQYQAPTPPMAPQYGQPYQQPTAPYPQYQQPAAPVAPSGFQAPPENGHAGITWHGDE